MGQKDHDQQDFSGGEVSPDLLFRDNLALHAKSMQTMLNFMPSLQGLCVRTPGTRFIQEVAGNPETARILPYLTPTGTHSLVLMTPNDGTTDGDLTLLANINGAVNSPGGLFSYATINENPNMLNGFDGWDATPINYISSKNGTQLGWSLEDGTLKSHLRRGHDIPNSDPIVVTLSQEFSVTENSTHVYISPQITYSGNLGQSSGADYGVTITLTVTDNAGATVFTTTLPNQERGGPTYTDLIRVDNAFDITDLPYTLTLSISANAGPGGDGNATNEPVVRVGKLELLSLEPSNIGSSIVTGGVPYTASQIKDVHYVQSPYPSPDDLGEEAAQELVMTQAEHPPRRLYLSVSGGTYVFEDIFTNDAEQNYEQWNWAFGGYPAACTSYVGRLVLAGSVDGITTPSGSSSEIVWTTIVGDWGKFTAAPFDPDDPPEVLPEDSVTFSTIYRSPIRWVAGQNTLIVGAESMEYTASADTIFQPADQGVQQQSTHGSNRVQPVGMGAYVMFAAEAGKRLRAARFNPDSEATWVANDLSLAHPRLLESGIVRMVRMRNPHQMVVVVLRNGQLAILSHDENAGVTAWSRLDVGATVIDAAVVINQGNRFDTGGDDVLYLLVQRVVGGTKKTYLEAIAGWKRGASWTYMNSYKRYLNFASSSVLDGLEHLEGEFVQVLADNRFLGTFQVSGGEVNLTDQFGDPITYVGAACGLSSPCMAKTLPLPSSDPGSKKRYTNMAVQTLGSTRPIINGYRPADREPVTPLGNSQRLDIVGTNDTLQLGTEINQQVTVEETAPLPLVISRIYGKVTENSV